MIELLAGAFVVLVFLVGLGLVYTVLLSLAFSTDWGVLLLYLFIGATGLLLFFGLAQFAGSLLTG